MSRTEPLMYTGATSASFTSRTSRELTEKRKLAKDDRVEAAQKLRPSAEIVNAVLDKEITLITKELANLPYIAQTSKENVKELLMAYQRNLVMLERVRTKLNTMLKEAK